MRVLKAFWAAQEAHHFLGMHSKQRDSTQVGLIQAESTLEGVFNHLWKFCLA